MTQYLLYPACVIVGFVLDWAVYERVVLTILSIWRRETRYHYSDTVCPRVILTVLGSVAIAYDALHESSFREGLWIGVGLLLASVTYGIAIAYQQELIVRLL